MGTGGRTGRTMLKYKLEYCLTKIVSSIAEALSPKNALLMGDLIGDSFFFIIRTRKQVAFNNLKQAFGGEKNEQELKQILRFNYRHFGRMLIEFARIPLFNRENIVKQIPIHNKKCLEELMNRKKGLLIFTGHFGNWEYLAAVLANSGYPLYCVFMEQKNLAVDNLIKQYRMKMGLLPLKIGGGAAKGVLTALKKKAMVLIVMDQDAGKDGAFIDFFGKPASTSKGPALIALKHKIPALMAFGIRDKDGLIQIYLEQFPDINQFPNNEKGITKFLTEYNKRLEFYIRKYPEQWFWMHRRWKTPPPVEKNL